MKWSEIAIHTTHEATEAVANILHEAGASGVVIEDSVEPDRIHEDRYGEIYALDKNDFPVDGVIVKAYLPVNSFLIETMKDISQSIDGLTEFGLDVGKNAIQTHEIDEEDWATAWKQYYHPVKISGRFTIVPTWEQYEPVESDELIIELDPGMAFGTGTHPTTVMCLQALEKYVEPGNTVVDVGTGSGVLSIGAALLGASHIHALDLDEVAVVAAKENILLNKVDEKITVTHGNLLDSVKEPADIIIANILAEVILSFSQDAYSILPEDGLFIVSGIIGQKRDLVKDDLIEKGFDIVESVLMEDWVAIVAQKGACNALQRYFLQSQFDDQQHVTITGDDGKHIVRVMRMAVGDSVIAVSDGEAFISTITEILENGVVIQRQAGSLTTNEMPVQATIACGLPKGDKLDLIVQKGTELGMAGILPFEAERSIVKWDAKKGDKKVERLRKIAKEAAEQCHRTVIPDVANPTSFKQLIAQSTSYDVLLFADEEDAKSGNPNRIAERLKNVHPEQTVLTVFGPEGGLSRNEAEALRSAGFLPIALGPRILRTETAPLYLLSAMSYEFE